MREWVLPGIRRSIKVEGGCCPVPHQGSQEGPQMGKCIESPKFKSTKLKTKFNTIFTRSKNKLLKVCNHKIHKF